MHPVPCLIDYADGLRVMLTVEDGDPEVGSVVCLRLTGEIALNSTVRDLRFEASPAAAKVLIDAIYEHTADDPTDSLRATLHAVEHHARDLEETIERVRAVVARGPRYTDGPMEAAADAVIEEVRQALDGDDR
jgi:hypothetical protein